jgi:hypothetical protein
MMVGVQFSPNLHPIFSAENFSRKNEAQICTLSLSRKKGANFARFGNPHSGLCCCFIKKGCHFWRFWHPSQDAALLLNLKSCRFCQFWHPSQLMAPLFGECGPTFRFGPRCDLKSGVIFRLM